MAIRSFDLSALTEIDGGRIAKELETELKRAVDDCKTRPYEDRVRRVVLQFEVTPVVDNTGDVPRIDMCFQVKGSMPSRKMESIRVGLKKNGALYYNPDSPDNPDQHTME